MEWRVKDGLRAGNQMADIGLLLALSDRMRPPGEGERRGKGRGELDPGQDAPWSPTGWAAIVDTGSKARQADRIVPVTVLAWLAGERGGGQVR